MGRHLFQFFISLFLGALLSGCSSMLFFPTPYLYYDPAKLGFNFEEVYFPSYDGTKLYGWYFHQKSPKVKAKGVVFYAHGNGQNISAQFPNISFVLDHGYDFFIFDYRGYGSSGGSNPTPPSAVGDTIAALKWIDARAKKDHLPYFAFGQSLGSALMLEALIEEKESIHPRMIILDSSFLSYSWAAASVLSQTWITTAFQPLAFFLVLDESAPGRRIRELAPTPILIFHGDRDRTIDLRLGKEVFEAALPPKEFVVVPGAGHIQALWGPSGEKYRSLLLSRMDSVLKN
jgi:uncharacterized protein